GAPSLARGCWGGGVGGPRHENRLDRTLQPARLSPRADPGRARLPAPHARGGQPVLPPPGSALRAGQPDRHQQQALRGLGRGLQRPDPGHRHPGPPAPPRDDGQHQGGQLPVAGEEEGRPARTQAQARGRPRGGGTRGGGGSPRVSRGTRTSVNRGHLTSVFSGHFTSVLTGASVAYAPTSRRGRDPRLPPQQSAVSGSNGARPRRGYGQLSARRPPSARGSPHRRRGSPARGMRRSMSAEYLYPTS